MARRHGPQSEMVGLGTGGDGGLVEAPAIINDREFNTVVSRTDLHSHISGPRMLFDIVQRLLDHAVQGVPCIR